MSKERDSIKLVSRSNLDVSSIRTEFESRQLDVDFLVPSSTGLTKDYMDSIEAHRDFLSRHNIHDFDLQGKGENYRYIFQASFTSNNINFEREVALFRTNRGDRRIRISSLSRYVRSGDLIAFSIINNRLEIINTSNTDLEDFFFQSKVSNSLLKLQRTNQNHIPPGNDKPERTSMSSKGFKRDPDVTAYVLNESKGKCENCGTAAPFLRVKDNSFYLEVHHIRRLADEGSDKPQNAIAVCPNCHREFHYGANKESLEEAIYSKISRLIKE